MLKGCCIDISWYDTLVEEGYDAITLSCKDIVSWDEETFEKNRSILAQGKLKTISLNSFYVPGQRLNGKGYDPDALRDYMNRLCPRAKALGYRYIGIGAPVARNIDADDDYDTCMAQFEDALSVLCDTAAEYDLEILLESVCSVECNFVRTMREAYAILKKLRLPNFHLVYDIYHEFMEDQGPELPDEILAEVRVVHVAQNEDSKRAYPDPDHATVFQGYWDRLTSYGYTGEWSAECFVGDTKAGIHSNAQLFQLLSERGNK